MGLDNRPNAQELYASFHVLTIFGHVQHGSIRTRDVCCGGRSIFKPIVHVLDFAVVFSVVCFCFASGPVWLLGCALEGWGGPLVVVLPRERRGTGPIVFDDVDMSENCFSHEPWYAPEFLQVLVF